MTGTRKWLWWALALVGLVLLVTGVWLTFNYRPSGTAAFPGQAPRGDQFVRVVHRIASTAFVPLALVVGIVEIVIRRKAWPAATGVFVLAVALSFTGFLLPWDQLALYAVTVGTRFKGLFDAAFSDEVKFVLVGGAEIGQDTIRNWFVLHAALLPVALAVCLAVLRRRSSSVGARTGA